MPFGKLGKTEPKFDSRTLTFENYTAHPVTVPPSLSWGYGAQRWPMFLNDRLGTCTIASKCVLVDEWSTRAKTPVILSDAAVLEAYKACSGYDPNNPATDRGASMLDSLNHFRRSGIGGRKICAYTALEPGNDVHVREAIFLFGGINVGVWLPVSAQAQSGPGKTWSVVRGQDAVWGGHAVSILGYNKDVLTCVTWGFVQYITWNFYHKYCDESYALISEDWLNQAGRSPSGFNLAALMADLKEIVG